jgi:hypothetical protein
VLDRVGEVGVGAAVSRIAPLKLAVEGRQVEELGVRGAPEAVREESVSGEAEFQGDGPKDLADLGPCDLGARAGEKGGTGARAEGHGVVEEDGDTAEARGARVAGDGAGAGLTERVVLDVVQEDAEGVGGARGEAGNIGDGVEVVAPPEDAKVGGRLGAEWLVAAVIEVLAGAVGDAVGEGKGSAEGQPGGGASGVRVTRRRGAAAASALS